MGPVFLALADVIRIHVDQIEHYGGAPGINDLAALRSAFAMPRASFGGEWLHKDLYEMAAAYAFHLTKDHPFVDGNKRTALASALVFLELNGIVVSDPDNRLYEAMLGIVSGNLDELGLAALLRALPAES